MTQSFNEGPFLYFMKWNYFKGAKCITTSTITTAITIIIIIGSNSSSTVKNVIFGI